MRFWIFILCGVFFLTASSVYANVVITEIMYDVDGADTGREWVEIQNIGSPIDLTGWKFFENGVNHSLVLAQGNIFIPQNGFAVIADNAEKFLLDWPGFDGTLFDSSFSFSNIGETLVLRDAGLVDNDTVTYSSDLGSNGDGNSLQKTDNQWVSVLPTPGKEFLIPGPIEESSNDNNLEKISSSISEPKPSPFQAFAGNDRSVLVGAEVYFEGLADGISEDLIPKARFLWNFGDGTIGEGKNIKHIFQYPGNYIINLDVSFGAYSASDSAKINVSSAGISISEIKPGNFLEIKNESLKIIDVSGFAVQINDSKIFNFPKDTMLSGNSFLTLDALTLGFEVLNSGESKILYPNGKILFSSKYESGMLGEHESISFDGEKWLKSEATPGVKNAIKKELIQQKKIITPTPSAGESPPLTIRGEVKWGGVTVGKDGEASVISFLTSESFWSEIKWLIFGLGVGVLLGVAYLFVKRRIFATKTNVSAISNSRE